MSEIMNRDRYQTLVWRDGADGGSAKERSPAEQIHSIGKVVKTTVYTRRSRILVVDDDQCVRETLSELLEDVGFDPVQAVDTLEALIILHADPTIDALVTDLTMPGDDGIMLIRQARVVRTGLPAILLTGYAEQVTAVAMGTGDQFHVLRKPVEIGHLVEQLELIVAK